MPTPSNDDFPIDHVMTTLREAVRPFPKAAMFALRDEGFGTAFQQIVACMLSIRTRDEVSLVAARRLFAVAATATATAETIAAMAPDAIDALIPDVTFHGRKAVQIRDIAVIARDDHDGDLPCDADVLLALPGIGPKCANLALGVACDEPVISVDIHVHRVTNRWGYVAARTPEATMAALERVLPERYRIEINQRLVPFGKHVCTGTRPKCSTCPLDGVCARVGVTSHR